MNLLLFSDLHADEQAALRLVKLSDRADVVIGAGDFGNVRQQITICCNILRAISRPVILVPGNNESLEELQAACSGWSSAVILHGTETEILGTKFFGIGGGIPTTPFGSWSFDLSEAEAEGILKHCPRQSVLISHSPPKGAVDVSSSGKSLGSLAVRDAIIRTNPKLVVCGHIHNCSGQTAEVGKTPVVNAGPSGIFWRL
jgi:uncharacterized protein